MEIISFITEEKWPKNTKITVTFSLEEFNEVLTTYLDITRAKEYNEGYSDAYDQLHREYTLTPKEESE